MSHELPEGRPLPEGHGVAISINGRTTIISHSAVKSAYTPNRRAKRPRQDVETTGKRGYMAAARRFIRAAGRRAGEGDEFELAELAALSDVLAEALAEAVAGQQAYGKSWAKIGAALGISREAAWQRWGRDKPEAGA